MAEASPSKQLMVGSADFHPERLGEQPIKKIVWKEKPEEDVETSIRSRLREFFRSQEISPEIKALGILTEEMLVKASKELELASFQAALSEDGLHTGEPTLYSIALYKDGLDLVLSSLVDYGNASLSAIPLSLSELDIRTGRIAADLARDRGNAIDILLSSTANSRQRNSAKLEILRYLAKAKPGSIRPFGEMGGLIPAIGLAYTADKEAMMLKLYTSEIPDTDPFIGEFVEFYQQSETYKKTVETLSNDDLTNMTVSQIEQWLKRLPPWAKRVLVGKYDYDAGNRANRFFDFLKKLGIKGNQQQQMLEKTRRISYGFHGFSGELRKKILETITTGHLPEDPEIGLTDEKIDLLFKESYEYRGYHKMPRGFSITKAIREEVPLVDLPL